MTAEEFFEQLEEVREDFDWKLEPVLREEGERRARVRFRVRAVRRTRLGEGAPFDPIGALCYAVTERPYWHESWLDATEILGLSRTSAADIIAAANDCTWTGPEGDRRQDERLAAIRLRLIFASGLVRTRVGAARPRILTDLA